MSDCDIVCTVYLAAAGFRLCARHHVVTQNLSRENLAAPCEQAFQIVLPTVG